MPDNPVQSQQEDHLSAITFPPALHQSHDRVLQNAVVCIVLLPFSIDTYVASLLFRTHPRQTMGNNESLFQQNMPLCKVYYRVHTTSPRPTIMMRHTTILNTTTLSQM